MKAVNLGHDADTTAAIAGGLAGIFYGEIPQEWLNELRGKTVIEESIKDMASMIYIDWNSAGCDIWILNRMTFGFLDNLPKKMKCENL